MFRLQGHAEWRFKTNKQEIKAAGAELKNAVRL